MRYGALITVGLLACGSSDGPVSPGGAGGSDAPDARVPAPDAGQDAAPVAQDAAPAAPDAAPACPAEAETLAGPLGVGETRLIVVQAPDGSGPVVFWGNRDELVHEEESGIFAARPGQPAVRLLANTDILSLAVAEVPAGFLICYTTGSGDPLPDAGCFTVDAAITVPDAAATAPRPDGLVYPRVFVRLGGALYALLPGNVWDTFLVAVDADGHPASQTNLDCGPPFAPGPADTLLCLKRSSPNCGSQFDEPADCTYSIRTFAADGRRLSEWPGAVPFGSYGNQYTVYLAARPDGVLAAWTSRDTEPDGTEGRRTTHLLPFGPDGTPRPPTTLPMGPGALAATDDGYLLVGGMPLPGEDAYRWWPAAIGVDAQGVPQGPPRWLVTPTAAERVRSGGQATAIGLSGAGEGQVGQVAQVAWIDSRYGSDGQPLYQIRTRPLPADLTTLAPTPELPAPPPCAVFAPVPMPPPPPPPPPLPCHPVNGVCPEGCPIARGAPIDPTHGCIQFADAVVLGCYASAPADDGLSCQTSVQSGEVYIFDRNAVVAGPDDQTFRPCTGRERASAQDDCAASSHVECAPPLGASCLTSEDCGVWQMCFDPLGPEHGRCQCEPGTRACGDCCCAD